MVIHKKCIPKLGFSLIELIVSISVVAIVTGVVLARHNAFNGAVLLRNQAYEIAFAVRQAQQLAVSGQTGALTTTQRQRYGVEFSTAADGAVNRQSFRLYKDNNNNGVFDSGDTELQVFRLDSRFQIVGLSTAGVTRGSMRVLFERPLFDAKFYQGSSNALVTGPARVVIRPTGSSSAERIIIITASGQVTVE